MTAKAKPADPSDVLDPKKALVPSVLKIDCLGIGFSAPERLALPPT